MNRSYSKIRHIKESNEKLEKRILEEQLIQNIKTAINNGIGTLMGNTGNKFWDAAKKGEVGKMKDGNSPNEKHFCLDDGCENLIIIFSDGRAIFEQQEFDKKTNGKMLFNSDGSFIFKWDDGGKSKKYMPK